ncbi:DUF3343 domain-containing protein [Mordavella massiliensis]|uniref:DUF3343 domain-containing protein n=1 Tax=Mordavella massiliensis TaxID=1871024 RepID=A0A939BGX7_9CLOT|nr:DUF3343 domain-containing protein [Mordavella massiliensis]MBM6948206.1 DUF3343 domain-containing protein [Mordavella massiliensis]
MKEIQYYVLFPNHDNGMRLYQKLKKEGVRSVIAPTPRSASKCCGISLLVKEEDLGKIRACVEENGIEILEIAAVEKDVNPGRDRYC